MPFSYSANLGFLWPDLPLPQRVHAAAKAGFSAVECHWPYDTPPGDLRAALRETGLRMLSINTAPGDLSAGEFGLLALPARRAEAGAAVAQAMDYAAEIGAEAVHVMAGRVAADAVPQALSCFLDTLSEACDMAAARGLDVLIEALNPFDVPGYLFGDTHAAASAIAEMSRPNLGLMFDCYHVARSEGDVAARLRALWPVIGHIQIAGVPDRGRPDQGRFDYRPVLDEIREAGWTRPIGAEYRPDGATEAGLGWLGSEPFSG